MIGGKVVDASALAALIRGRLSALAWFATAEAAGLVLYLPTLALAEVRAVRPDAGEELAEVMGHSMIVLGELDAANARRVDRLLTDADMFDATAGHVVHVAQQRLGGADRRPGTAAADRPGPGPRPPVVCDIPRVPYPCSDYCPNQMTYDLRRLRLAGLTCRLPNTLTNGGIRIAIFYTKIYNLILIPLTAANQPQAPPDLRCSLGYHHPPRRRPRPPSPSHLNT